MTSIEMMPEVNPNKVEVEVVVGKKCGMCGSPYITLDGNERIAQHEGRGSSRCPGVGGRPNLITETISVDLSVLRTGL